MIKYKYSDEQLAEAVAISFTVANVLRLLGIRPAGGNQSHIKRRIESAGIDTSHFTGQGSTKGRVSKTRLTADQILVLTDEYALKTKTHQLRRALLEIDRPLICEGCGTGDTYNGKPLTLEIDHISGQAFDHRKENLRFLCPNCHSQQETSKPWKNRT